MERVHLDHFFFQNHKFLIIIDAYSNWIQVDVQTKVDSEGVIDSLKKFCANFEVLLKVQCFKFSVEQTILSTF